MAGRLARPLGRQHAGCREHELHPEGRGFSARIGASGREFGSGEHLRLIERFTRVDARTLQYEFTVDDPSTFTRPFTARFPMSLSDQRIYEYACHEGNYGLPNILRAGRARDAQATPSTSERD